MKTCACCTVPCDDFCPTCPNCGEASWLPGRDPGLDVSRHEEPPVETVATIPNTEPPPPSVPAPEVTVEPKQASKRKRKSRKRRVVRLDK